ncbi:MAG: hypothetical protein FD158_2925, partial [bacterium]
EPRVEAVARVESAVAALRAELDERLARQAASLDELGRRLAVLAVRPAPDLPALSADLEQRLAAGLAGQQARIDRQAAEFETLRETLLARLDAQAGELAAKTGSLRQDLESVTGEVGRLGEALRAARTEIEARLAGLDAALETRSRAERVEHAEAAAQAEAAVREVAADLVAVRSELAALQARLDESRLRQFVADAVAGSGPAPATRDDDSVARDELDRLRAGFRRLTGMTLLGGALLLVIAVLALMRG